MARPLTKKDKRGVLYTRLAPVEAAIDALPSQDLNAIVRRAEIKNPDSREYFPSECLVYLIRDARRRDDEGGMMAIMPFLLSRCEAILNIKIRRQEFPNHKEAIDDILGDFTALFVADLTDHLCTLDFYECRFSLAFRSFYLGYIRRERARRKIHVEIPARDDPDDDRTDEDVLTTMSGDILRPWFEGRGQLSEELSDAISRLPPDEQKAVVLRFYVGLPEESFDPAKPSIASLCGVTPKTVRILRRIHTGKKRSDEYDRLTYTLYHLAGQANFGDGFAIEAVHLTDGITESVGTLRTRLIEKHGLPIETLLFLEDTDEPIAEAVIIVGHAGHAGVNAHVHRCHRITVPQRRAHHPRQSQMRAVSYRSAGSAGIKLSREMRITALCVDTWAQQPSVEQRNEFVVFP